MATNRHEVERVLAVSNRMYQSLILPSKPKILLRYINKYIQYLGYYTVYSNTGRVLGLKGGTHLFGLSNVGWNEYDSVDILDSTEVMRILKDEAKYQLDLRNANLNLVMFDK